MWELTLKKLTDETAKKAMLKWCDKPMNIKLIANAINCVYRFECQNKAYYLRITHEKIRSLIQLKSALDFQDYLYNREVPICKPIKSLNHAFIEFVKQDNLIFMTHVCEEVPGQEMHFYHKDLEVYFNWGNALAIFHQASSKYSPASEFSFLTWEDLKKEMNQYIDSEEKEIQKIYRDIQEWLASQKMTDESYGLIHGDMREANVICDNKSIYFIDFDEPVYHWWSQDIARAFLNSVSEKIDLWREPFLHFISGYKSQKNLSHEQLHQIPWLIKNKMMDIYLWTKNNWKDPIVPGGGDTKNWLMQLHNDLISQDLEEKFSVIYKDL